MSNKDTNLDPANLVYRRIKHKRTGEKKGWYPVSGRIPPDQVPYIDAACYKLGITRSDLVGEAAVERAREILGLSSEAA